MFVSILLADEGRNAEYLFVAVDKIEGSTVSGRVWNDVTAVKGLHHGSQIELPEDAISDWLISNPDGTEDGNLIGKYMDTMEQCRAKLQQ